MLIGSAGWLLVDHAAGLHSGAGPRLCHRRRSQLPGAASLARTTEVVKQIEKIALGRCRACVRVPAFAGLSGATRTLASNAAALFPVFDDPEVRAKKGLTANVITADLRKRLSAIEGAFVIVIPPPAVPGIGTGGGFAMRIAGSAGSGHRGCSPPRPTSWSRPRARRRV